MAICACSYRLCALLPVVCVRFAMLICTYLLFSIGWTRDMCVRVRVHLYVRGFRLVH